MNYKKLVDLAMLAGEVMLRNGAETYRVEDTINRILDQSNLSRKESYVIATGIMITLDDPTIEEITLVKRVNSRSTDLNKIARVNDVSRRFCNGEFNVDEAYERLEMISKEKKQYGRILNSLAIIFIVVGCAVMFGGTIESVFIALFIGIAEAIAILMCKTLKMNPFISDVLVSLFTAAFIMSCQNAGFIVDETNMLISASIMPLVPGVAITNAVRDTLYGDYVSGVARILEAFVTAAAVAIGVGAGIAMVTIIAGGKFI